MSENFIDSVYIRQVLAAAREADGAAASAALDKAERFEGLSHREVAALLVNEDAAVRARIFEIAGKIKRHIYGNRVVLFAPLYVSDHCINRCSYCNYNTGHSFQRRRLTQDELREEVRALEAMGHKRLALEAGEHEKECPIEYVLECMRTIYDMKFENGAIRRINVNIAATTVENYRALAGVGIGTYILFQETYDKEVYEKVHLAGPKKDFVYHLTAFDRAHQGGIDDVGGGVLFGLADPYFDALALMIHNEHLEEAFNVGFHTISVPRICPADGVDLSAYPNLVDDAAFEKLVAVLRLAVPFTGIILSTRESRQMRERLLAAGVSQISAGSCTGVGGYTRQGGGESVPQFTVNDERSALEIISELIDLGHIPSFCTACYRSGRTGDRFMSLAKSGAIKNVCLPNALMTLSEYAVDYGGAAFQVKAFEAINAEIPGIANETIRSKTIACIDKIKAAGERDFYV